MDAESALKELRSQGRERNREGMGRFGIRIDWAFGVPVPKIRAVAKRIGKDHVLAGELWDTKFHEARILAAMVDEPSKVTERQMERWVAGFDSWDLCDQCCGVLFDKTPLAYAKALEWAKRSKEFVRRAGFVMMAELAVHDKEAPDAAFVRFFPVIEAGASDERNFVKKAVSWALRQIGKRSLALNRQALELAKGLAASENRSARWVGSDAVRELRSAAVRRRLSSSSLA